MSTAQGPSIEPPLSAAQAILARNMFDSQTGPMEWLAPSDVQKPAGCLDGECGPGDEGNAQVVETVGEPLACSGVAMRLVGALVSPTSPDLSFASIEAGGKTLLYRPGMSVEGHELVGIREHRVFLRPSGRPICQIAMFAPIVAAAPPPPPPPPPPADDKPPPAPKSSISEEDLNAGITQVSDTNYNISRQLLDRVLGAQSELMRAARVIPYEENGRTVGVKVYGIRRNALLGKLGIQNGDVLRTINGFDLSSPDTALEAYTKLREMDQFSISMIRRGAPRTMEYQVK
jgi:general secretion pathway protein C